MSVSYLNPRKTAERTKAKTPEQPTPRYAGPVIVDPASNGNKLATDYANPWGRDAVAPAIRERQPGALRLNERLVIAVAFFAMGWVVGLLCGVAA